VNYECVVISQQWTEWEQASVQSEPNVPSSYNFVQNFESVAPWYGSIQLVETHRISWSRRIEFDNFEESYSSAVHWARGTSWWIRTELNQWFFWEAAERQGVPFHPWFLKSISANPCRETRYWGSTRYSRYNDFEGAEKNQRSNIIK